MTHTSSAAHTTQSATSATGAAPTSISIGLRSVHLVRAAFSFIWVALVLSTSSSLVGADELTVTAGALLISYPLWDVLATLGERRFTGAGSANPVSTANLALGGAATVAMTVAVFTTLGSTFLVFGIWALLSGALQLAVALRRRHTVGAQWPMIISGALSVLAGASIAAMATSDTSGLGTMAGYSAFGAFWFLVSALALTIRDRRVVR
jgi:uncharacterized membrane protein HdeD (DUF308 family)